MTASLHLTSVNVIFLLFTMSAIASRDYIRFHHFYVSNSAEPFVIYPAMLFARTDSQSWHRNYVNFIFLFSPFFDSATFLIFTFF